MDLTGIGWECVEWIYVAQYRDQWQAVAHTVTNILDPEKVGNFVTS
jgi:hypothetical protein